MRAIGVDDVDKFVVGVIVVVLESGEHIGRIGVYGVW